MKLTITDWKSIRGLPLFADMTPDEIGGLMNGNDIRNFGKGDSIYHKGGQPDCMFLVLEGSVKLCRPTIDGNEGIIGIFHPGHTIGECDMFQGLGRTTDAIALAPSRLLRIDAERMKQQIAKQPEIAFVMMASAARYVKELIEQVERTKISSGTRRVADYLLSLSPKDIECCEITLPYEKSLIANRLAMTPESLSRALQTLKRVGVGVNREVVVVKSCTALSKYVSTGILP